MSADSPLDRTSPPLAVTEQIDAVCDRFEAQWKAGSEPRLADYLTDVPVEARPELLRELLRLELHYRRCRGQKPRPDNYKSLPPEYAGLIDVLLAETSPYVPSPSENMVGYRTDGLADRYRIEGRLGGGGMGDVYRARQLHSDRIVALKMIRSDYLSSDAARERFRTEARALAKFDHPHIVRVFDSGESDGQPYMAMEFIEGGTLAQAAAGGQWAVAGGVKARRVAGLVETLARAVEYAHQRGVVHRDLKPGNVLLTADGTPKIADFGLARLQGIRADQTQPGQLLGTYAYMAPEQARGQAEGLGTATDIYGLGGILYHLLTSRAPHQGNTREEVLDHASRGQVTPPRQLNPRVPTALERICLKALAPDPGQRYASACVLADELRRYRLRLRRWIFATAALITAAFLGLAAWLFVAIIRPAATTVPLTGELNVLIWSEDKRGLRVQDWGALPVRNKEQVQVEVRLSRPAYPYVLWLDSEGVVTPLYPWNDGKDIVYKDLSTALPNKPAVADVRSPGVLDHGWKVGGKTGLDTILLLARDTPLPADVSLADLVGRLLPTKYHNPHEWAVRGSDADQPIGFVNRGADRAPEEEAARIDDPLLQVMARLREHFEVIRAVRFAHEGD
jgi:tRNA A-37 threonylcarbamoyl transferase component Bud32